MVSKYRFDRIGETEGSAKQNLLNLISINSTKISPLRVAPVEMTTILLEFVNGSVVKGHLFAIYQSQEVFNYAQTDNCGV